MSTTFEQGQTTAATDTTTASTTAVVAEKPKTEPRGYVVLRKNASASPASPQTWEFLRNVEASSADQAVRRAAEILIAAGEEGSNTLVAVTASRFVPRTVSAQIKPQLKLS
jgi:hypothetical protein